MIRLQQHLKKHWAWLPWLLMTCFIFVSCEAPYLNNKNQTRRSFYPRIQALPTDLAQPVYQEGMNGVLQKALAQVQTIQKAYKQGSLSESHWLPLDLIMKEAKRQHKLSLTYYKNALLDMKQRGISPEIMQRLEMQKDNYLRGYEAFQGNLNPHNSQKTHTFVKERIVKIEKFLRKVQPNARNAVDPNNLPQQRTNPIQRPPMTTSLEYAEYLELPPEPMNMPIAAPKTEDLKETKEVKLTTGIKSLATKLKSPLAIFSWVRNNIEFTPTYGSIQSADYCRMSRKCNAFDTASLLIGMLRAQKISARYVFGTVKVPIEKARNWLGTFSSTNGPVGRALASGGIPATTVYIGGKAKYIQMEHVWVEAWIDYIPSRGRTHVKGDTWIPMDPSFKQHTYKKSSIDMQKATGFQAKATLDQAKKGAQTNSLGGVTKQPDLKVLRDAVNKSRKTFDKNVSTSKGTYDGWIGSKKIQQFQYGFLPAALPYGIKVVGRRLPEVPDKLRHKIRITIGTKVSSSSWSWSSIYGNGGFGSSSDFSIQLALVEVVGKKLSLAYNPASISDTNAIKKYAPKIPAGKSVAPASAWPKSLPTVINLKPTLMLNDKVLAQGKATRLGSDNQFKIYFTGPRVNKVINNTIVAGTYQAIAINPGKIAAEHLKNMRAEAQKLQQELQKKNSKNLTREKVYGAHLHSAGLGYWSQQGVNNKVFATRMGILDIQLPSCGLFSYDLDVTYAGFGPFTSPRSVKGGRVSTDIDHDSHVIVSYTNDTKAEVRYFSTIGVSSSAWEATIWETANKTKGGNASKGISATHMLQYAASKGVPIYSIRRSNLRSILPKLSLARSVINDIKSAVNAGKSVVTAAKELVKDGWKGVGYIITDEKTGAGAYMISGGKSGGGGELDNIPTWLATVLGVFMIGAGIVGSIGLGIALAVIGVAMAAFDGYASWTQIDNNNNLTQDQKEGLKALLFMMFMIGALIAIAGIWFGAVAIFVAMAMYFIYMSLMISMILSGIVGILENINNRPIP